jgi:hypothetical protein
VQRVGQADTVLLIKTEKLDGRTVSTRVTFSRLREDPDHFPQPVSFGIVRGASGAPVLTTQGIGAKDDRPLDEQIVSQLELGPKTKKALATALRRSHADVDRALTSLFSEKVIRTGTAVIRGKEYNTFDLVPNRGNGHANGARGDRGR